MLLFKQIFENKKPPSLGERAGGKMNTFNLTKDQAIKIQEIFGHGLVYEGDPIEYTQNVVDEANDEDPGYLHASNFVTLTPHSSGAYISLGSRGIQIQWSYDSSYIVLYFPPEKVEKRYSETSLEVYAALGQYMVEEKFFDDFFHPIKNFKKFCKEYFYKLFTNEREKWDIYKHSFHGLPDNPRPNFRIVKILRWGEYISEDHITGRDTYEEALSVFKEISEEWGEEYPIGVYLNAGSCEFLLDNNGGYPTYSLESLLSGEAFGDLGDFVSPLEDGTYKLIEYSREVKK